MYYYNQYNRLFSQDNLGSYLELRFVNLEAEIKKLSLEKINSIGEQNLVKEFLNKYVINLPILKENEINIDALEAEIEVNSQREFDDEGPYKTNGLRISVQIPFDGDSNLFNCRASTFSISGTPKADIDRQMILLHYETIEKDPEKIKNLWGNDIRSIKQNLEWINKDIINYNNSLENNIKSLILNRKKKAEDNQSLIDKIKS